MKTITLIKKAQKLLDADKQKQQDQTESLKVILHKLTKKKIALKQKLSKEQDEKSRRHIQNNLQIIVAQRKKGLRMMKKLMAEGRS